MAIANTARIITLVVLTHVLHQPDLAEMIHVPLGLMGFIIASLTTWILLRWVPRHRSVTSFKNDDDTEAKHYPKKQDWEKQNPEKQSRPSSLQATLILITSILALTLIPHPPRTAPSIVDLSELQWSTLIQTQPIALNPYEQKFFANYPGVTTQKQRFQFQGLTGSVVLVTSPTWQAHHAPELCLTAFGYHIDHMIGKALTPALTGRWLTLDNGQKTSTYWFQSATRTTDDFFVRFWGEVFRQDSTWTLVSIVFDQPYRSDEPPVQSFLTLVHDALAQIQPVGEPS
ncbi:MAG: exosortase O [Leptolyngbyaceae cyanobacterium CSU_1_4]|nr:exosortase O [Leptolyngbyaceae cyanobacterium CSU_1_4]